MATVTTRISLADHGRPMTIEEFLEAEEEPGHRYELARGVLEVTNLPNVTHGQVVSNLIRIVVRYDGARPGYILRSGIGNEFPLLLPGKQSGRKPDLTVALRKWPRNFRGRRDPVLVAEVVSKSSFERDHRAKREEYLAFGILEYWIIDYLERKMTLLARKGDAWVERTCLEGQPIPSVILPGITSTVADLWIDLDAYDAADFEEEIL
jgi:Uma2 family endonuclease